MFANDSPTSTVRKVSRVPPKYSHRPRLAVSEAIEKQVKMAAVPSRAVTIMLGLIEMAKSINDPRPRPATKNNKIGECRLADDFTGTAYA